MKRLGKRVRYEAAAGLPGHTISQQSLYKYEEYTLNNA